MGGPRPRHPLNFQKTGNSFDFMQKMEIFGLVPPQIIKKNAEILVPLASSLVSHTTTYFYRRFLSQP